MTPFKRTAEINIGELNKNGKVFEQILCALEHISEQLSEKLCECNTMSYTPPDNTGGDMEGIHGHA